MEKKNEYPDAKDVLDILWPKYSTRAQVPFVPGPKGRLDFTSGYETVCELANELASRANEFSRNGKPREVVRDIEAALLEFYNRGYNRGRSAGIREAEERRRDCLGG